MGCSTCSATGWGNCEKHAAIIENRIATERLADEMKELRHRLGSPADTSAVRSAAIRECQDYLLARSMSAGDHEARTVWIPAADALQSLLEKK